MNSARNLNSNNSNNKSIRWNNEQEQLAIQWGERAAGYIWLHNEASNNFSQLKKLIGVPAIFFGTLASVTSVSTVNTEDPNIYIKLVNSGASFGTLLLTTLSNFLKYSELMEAHRNMAKEFSNYSRAIQTQLSFTNDDRDDPKIFLKKFQQKFDDLIAKAPDIPDKIIKMFIKQFTDDSIAKPLIVNAMSRIVAYESSEVNANVVSICSPTSKGLFKRVVETEYKIDNLSKDIRKLSQSLQIDNDNTKDIELPNIIETSSSNNTSQELFIQTDDLDNKTIESKRKLHININKTNQDINKTNRDLRNLKEKENNVKKQKKIIKDDINQIEKDIHKITPTPISLDGEDTSSSSSYDTYTF